MSNFNPTVCIISAVLIVDAKSFALAQIFATILYVRISEYFLGNNCKNRIECFTAPYFMAGDKKSLCLNLIY